MREGAKPRKMGPPKGGGSKAGGPELCVPKPSKNEGPEGWGPRRVGPRSLGGPKFGETHVEKVVLQNFLKNLSERFRFLRHLLKKAPLENP